MNDQYQPVHVNTFEENHYQPDRVIEMGPVQNQPEQETTLENERFYEKPIETLAPAVEHVQEVVVPDVKTEPWKQTFVPVSTPEPVVQAAVTVPPPEMLFGSEETQNFRARWNEVQAKFVDEPGCSVREADALVADVMAQITEMFANQRQTLESQWSKGDTSTEELRQVLQHYRAFFNRLLK